MILSTFSWKWLQNDWETTGLSGFRDWILPLRKVLVFLINFKVFEHRKNASRNTYKRNTFLMILSTFSWNWLQND